MMTSLRLLSLALSVTALLAAPAAVAQTQTQPPSQTQPPQAQLAQQDLYLDALRSLSEGRQGDASEALARMIEREPQHAGAWLDLAIIQCELGHEAEAERLFATIETKFAPPPAILAVIADQRTKGCKGWQPQKRTSVVIGRGTDSNVNQGASDPFFTVGSGDVRVQLQLLPEYLPRRDSYTVAAVDHVRDLTSNGALGFVYARAVHNDSLTKYNSGTLIGGVEQPWRAGNWSLRGAGLAVLQSLGGKLYQVQTQAQLRAAPPLGLPQHVQASVTAGVSHIHYPTLGEFDSNTLELRGSASYRGEKSLLQASTGYLSDRAQGARPGGDRSGWLMSLYGKTQLTPQLSGELSWTRQSWRSDNPYSPGFIDEVRDQRTQVWRGALSYPISARQSIQLELRQVRNRENISLFQYSSRQVQISWQWQDF